MMMMMMIMMGYAFQWPIVLNVALLLLL